MQDLKIKKNEFVRSGWEIPKRYVEINVYSAPADNARV